MTMAGLPKKYAKMGFARGWREYKKVRNKGRRKGKVKMAKRKTRRTYTRRAAPRRKKRSTLSYNRAAKIVIGAGVAALYEIFISPRIPIGGTMQNVIELVLGLIIAGTPGIPMAIKAGGAALATINAFQLITPLISSAAGKVTGAATWGDY
jgi:hypothetical protein